MKIPVSSRNFNSAVAELEKIVSPRKYWLHNQAGGEGWRVKRQRDSKLGYQCIIEIDDPVTATFVTLKLGK